MELGSHLSFFGLCCLLFLTFHLYDFSTLHLQTPVVHSCSVVRRAGSSDLHGLPLLDVKLEGTTVEEAKTAKCLKDIAVLSENSKGSSSFIGQVQATSCVGPIVTG